MILVTGAAGKTGRALIEKLAARGQAVRALVRANRRDAPPHASMANVEYVEGDLLDAASLSAALKDVRALYLICPNMHPKEEVMGELVIKAAQQNGVEHFVYHSVLHPQVEAMPHHWHKMRVEERLFASGLPFTILQPTAYMQNLLANFKDNVLRNPYPVEARLSLIDLNDVAEAAATVLTERGHENAIYELCGTAPLSQTQVAEIFSQVLGHPVRAEAMPLETWEHNARAAGLNDYVRETLLAMFHYYAHFGLADNPNVLRWLLKREPASLESFVRNYLA
ncbi:MAG: NmrA family NAD(P)-binding protein [Anaerolineales bacterium]|nr:NmrA family NAD(P)-binding protein [Anaerolineales bacterium]